MPVDLISWQIEDFMQSDRLSAVGFCVAVLLSAGSRRMSRTLYLRAGRAHRSGSDGVLLRRAESADATQERGWVRTAAGKFTFAALVDASGYSTAIQQKYQGMLITESKLNIGGSELLPGAYGFGFAADKFVVMNVANQDALDISLPDRCRIEASRTA